MTFEVAPGHLFLIRAMTELGLKYYFAVFSNFFIFFWDFPIVFMEKQELYSAKFM